MRTREILGVNIAISNYKELAKQSIAWAAVGESRTVMFANVHMVMEAREHAEFRAKLNRADIVNSDGMPLVWALQAIGERDAERVYGPDATRILLGAAEKESIPVGFYGGDESTLAALIEEIQRRHPRLHIVFTKSPPFRPLSPAEDDDIVREISASGARMLFVGLGCPKQERWIIDHRGRIFAVMLAVGAAFDFLARTKPQAPRWMMRTGFEWAFRLASEPRRLIGRYLRNNPKFVFLFFHHWVRHVLFDRISA